MYVHTNYVYTITWQTKLRFRHRITPIVTDKCYTQQVILESSLLNNVLDYEANMQPEQDLVEICI